MGVRYYRAHATLVPEYHCQREGIEHAQPLCARIVGGPLDRAIGDLLVETMSPLALEAALGIEAELAARAAEADGLRRAQVERARYEAELAQRRYLRVDPDNRLVADSLEADWNAKLRALADAQDAYERTRETDHSLVDPAERARILALAMDFPRLWAYPATPQRERKRMVRLLVDDVTLLRADEIVAHVRFRRGAVRTLHLPLPIPAPDLRRTDPAVVAELDRLLDDHTDAEAAELLNAAGLRPGVAERFTAAIVMHIRHKYRLTPRFTRLRARGLLTARRGQRPPGRPPLDGQGLGPRGPDRVCAPARQRRAPLPGPDRPAPPLRLVRGPDPGPAHPPGRQEVVQHVVHAGCVPEPQARRRRA